MGATTCPAARCAEIKNDFYIAQNAIIVLAAELCPEQCKNPLAMIISRALGNVSRAGPEKIVQKI